MKKEDLKDLFKGRARIEFKRGRMVQVKRKGPEARILPFHPQKPAKEEMELVANG